MLNSPRLLTSVLVSVLAFTAARCPAAAEGGRAGVSLQEAFCRPPDAVKPWAYWWWVKGNVSEASITSDLEAMKRKGFSGFLMFDARGYHEEHVPPPESRMEFMSPEWRRMLKFAMSEADRLGLQMSVNLSSCAGALKGPWEVGDDAPKKLVWTSAEVQGPKRVRCELRREDAGRRWDVAVLAVRHDGQAGASDSPGKPGAVETVNLSESWQEVQAEPASKRPVVEVVDVSNKVDSKGRLAWDVPEGRWTLVRFACIIMEGHEFDVDVLSEKAVEAYFGRMGRALLEDAGPLAGKTLTHFYSVSWEGAAPTWSLGFERQFERYRGYRPQAFLPVLAGMTVQSREVSDRFLRDYHKTLGDCFMNHCYGKLRELCNRAGVQWHSESGGPWNRKIPDFQHADQLAFLGRNDMPQGEFWHPNRGLNRPPAMAAHIYGRPRAATEAFTHMRAHWSAYPAVLKPDADAAFCDGINHFIWHTFSASPPEFGKPGIEYFAGTHVNPNVTWFEQSGAFLAYLARCQLMLREGRFAADVCCYTGDKPYLHWGRGEKWSAKPTLVLGKGYAYDLVNTEVLLDRMSVKDGDLVLPDGMRYRVLAVDLEDETVPPEALRKIVELAEAGATIVLGQRRPARTPGLRDYPACDEEVVRLADQLWGPEGANAGCRSLGRGTIICGTEIDEALRAEGILRDFEGPWDYIHRRSGDADVYFVAGSGHAECTFRTTGKEPELWDPATGAIRDAVWYRATDDGRTVVPIRLPENGSAFVVFRRPAERRHVVSVSAPAEDGMEIEGRSGDAAQLRLWQKGRFVLETSEGERVTVEAAKLPEPLALAGPWEVRFAPGWGAPESIVFDALTPWNEHPNEGIRYFSGTAGYRKTFELDESQAGGLVRLALGEVGHVAEVRVNGRPLGVVWTAPWTVDLTGLVKAGENELEIEVTNVWVNRLIGDSRLPVEKRLTRSNVRLFRETDQYRRFEGFSPKDALMPSGLLGPVRLEFGSGQEARF
ncbi:MAG TPA: glycosyl hydrolase [Thermoguttaceae bacterium]|nr:glycosyl hydrolase [Thermoguttaceae bacterium]